MRGQKQGMPGGRFKGPGWLNLRGHVCAVGGLKARSLSTEDHVKGLTLAIGLGDRRGITDRLVRAAQLRLLAELGKSGRFCMGEN